MCVFILLKAKQVIFMEITHKGEALEARFIIYKYIQVCNRILQGKIQMWKLRVQVLASDIETIKTKATFMAVTCFVHTDLQ